MAYTQFCHHYRQHVKSIGPAMRQVHKAGEKVFVDYAGMSVPYVDIQTGERHEAQIFVGCLGASQYTFVEATATQQLSDWIQSHIHMWEYFGGVSEIVVPDNLKSGITKAHRYDPDINANYQHFSEHYGVAIVPARVSTPKDKAKVENAVGCVERQILAPLRNRLFTSLSEINQLIQEGVKRFNQQPFQKMKTSRFDLYESLDLPALKSLPPERYQYAQWVKAKVNIDYHFVYNHHFYSVPYQYIHQGIELRISHKTIECFYQNERIAVHPLSSKRYGFTTVPEHMPPAHKAYAEWTPERMKQWAAKIGPYTAQFIEHMIQSRAFPQQAFRACLGLLRLGKRYGEERLENACIRALQAGSTRYQQVESILKNKLDSVSLPEQKAASRVATHINVRGANYYQQFTK